VDPGDIVVCERFAARLSAARCVSRHYARQPSGGNFRGFPMWPACAGCSVGEARLVELRVAGFEPRRFPQVFNIDRDNVQRLARERLRRSAALHRDRIPNIDRPPGRE
jgi:hypothetical protein